MRLAILASTLLLAMAGPALAQQSDPAAAYAAAKARADAGDPAAQWDLGMRLLNGNGVARDEQAAYRYVRASGDAGHERGMISTAVMLATGQGVAADHVQARDWYRRAAERHRSAHALRGYAGMLLTGQGGDPEVERGLAYLELAAEAGDVNAGRILEAVGPQAVAQIDRTQVDGYKFEWVTTHGQPR